MQFFIPTLNGGEFSDLIDGRLDYQSRMTGGRVVENFIPTVQGALVSRPGTKYCGTIKTQSSRTELIPFVNNTSVPYQIEMGEYYFRYWYNGSRIVGTTANTDLCTITAASKNSSRINVACSGGHNLHNGDIVYISGVGGMTQLNGNYYVIKNKSTSSTVTVTTPTIATDTLPFASSGSLANGQRVTISGLAGTLGTTLNGNSYLVANLTSTTCKLEDLTTGANIDFAGLTTGAGGTITINNAFELRSLDANAWSATRGNVDSSAYGAFTSGGTVTWDGTCHCYSQANLFSGSFFDVGFASLGDTTFFAHKSKWPTKLVYNSNTNWTFGYHTHTSDYTTLPFFHRGPMSADLSSTTQIAGDALTSTSGASGYFYTSQDTFASTDVGRTIHFSLTNLSIKDAMVIITAYVSARQVTVTPLSPSDFQGGSLAVTFQVDRFALGAYSATTGYPHRVCFFQNRLVYMGTTSEPTRVDLSRSNVYSDFSTCQIDDIETIEDFRGISASIASSGTGAIQWGHSGDRALLIGTYNDAFVLSGTDGEILKPAKIQAHKITAYGSANVQPAGADGKVCFIQRLGRKIRGLGFSATSDGYDAKDETRLAEHITDSGIVRAIFQADPFQSFYYLRDDGVIITCTVNVNENVSAFAKQKIAGVFGSGNAVVECVSVVPSVSGFHDEVYIIVKRTINGSTTRYIERFANSHLSDDTIDQNHTITVDSCVTYDSTPATTITGLSHLEGQAVAVVADGVVITGKTVSSGQITLTTAASVVNVGLQYYPIFESMTIEGQHQEKGLSGGRKKRINRVAIGFYKTVGCSIGRSASYLSDISFSSTVTPYTAKITWFTGAKHEIFKGDIDEDARIYIKQPYPLPICIRYINAEGEIHG